MNETLADMLQDMTKHRAEYEQIMLEQAGELPTMDAVHVLALWDAMKLFMDAPTEAQRKSALDTVAAAVERLAKHNGVTLPRRVGLSVIKKGKLPR